MRKEGRDRYMLVGVLSGAHHDCVQRLQSDGPGPATKDSLPDISTRITSFLDWIDAVTTEYTYSCGFDFPSFTVRECVL